MCGGDQNVSRPILRCQEMSQCAPTMPETTASRAVQTNQGTALSVSRERVIGRARLPTVAVGVAMSFPRDAEDHGTHNYPGASQCPQRNERYIFKLEGVGAGARA